MSILTIPLHKERVQPMQVISFLNNKGGVGKTTLCCNLAQGLAIAGKKVLCVDNDSQHSLGNRLLVKSGDVTIKTLYRDYNDATDYTPFLREAVSTTAIPRLHCLTSSFKLINADVKSLKALKDLFNKSEIAEYYDYVLIDNHPGLDRLQQAAILASERFFVPVTLRQQTVEGMPEFMRFLHNLTIPTSAISIIPNNCGGLKSEGAMLQRLTAAFGSCVTATCIPKDRMVEEVETQGKILFVDRLVSSRSVPYLIKLITELFPQEYQEESLRRTVEERRTHFGGRRVLPAFEQSPDASEEVPVADGMPE
jgi:cellulose biosynthesis protein BcsQ